MRTVGQGHSPGKEETMKRIWMKLTAVLLVAAALASLCACGGQPAGADTFAGVKERFSEAVSEVYDHYDGLTEPLFGWTWEEDVGGYTTEIELPGDNCNISMTVTAEEQDNENFTVTDGFVMIFMFHPNETAWDVAMRLSAAFLRSLNTTEYTDDVNLFINEVNEIGVDTEETAEREIGAYNFEYSATLDIAAFIDFTRSA